MESLLAVENPFYHDSLSISPSSCTLRDTSRICQVTVTPHNTSIIPVATYATGRLKIKTTSMIPFRNEYLARARN